MEQPRRRGAWPGREKITSLMMIKSNKVAASKDNPEFIVEMDNGNRATHKAGALKKDRS